MFLFALGLLIGLATGLLTRVLAYRDCARCHPAHPLRANLTVTTDSLTPISARYEDRQ